VTGPDHALIHAEAVPRHYGRDGARLFWVEVTRQDGQRLGFEGRMEAVVESVFDLVAWSADVAAHLGLEGDLITRHLAQEALADPVCLVALGSHLLDVQGRAQRPRASLLLTAVSWLLGILRRGREASELDRMVSAIPPNTTLTGTLNGNGRGSTYELQLETSEQKQLTFGGRARELPRTGLKVLKAISKASRKGSTYRACFTAHLVKAILQAPHVLPRLSYLVDARLTPPPIVVWDRHLRCPCGKKRAYGHCCWPHVVEVAEARSGRHPVDLPPQTLPVLMRYVGRSTQPWA